MSNKVPISFEKYVTFQELTDYLQETAIAYPGLTHLESVGRSYQGRDIWAMTVTNKDTGEHNEKPAIYIDGNIHAGEVTGAAVALYLIDYLVNNFGKDEEVTHALNTSVFYILPRVNPDGAEAYITSPAMLRSSVRPWPDEEVTLLPGLHRADVNDDGKILQMRVRDDNKGEWKPSKKDPRLMVARCPGERKGPFYRVYPEGYINDYEGEPIPINPTIYGLDLNRNFPSNWHTLVPGGGDYPGSEPETKAIVDFITKHPNIGAAQALHTSGGFYYRNPCQYPEDQMDPDDLRATKEIARQGTIWSGYPDVKSPNCSTFTEWAYEHKGIIAYTTELWNRYTRAGIGFIEFQSTVEPEERENLQVKLLSWNDRELAGKGFVPWTPFLHPQLGQVDIGGWDTKFCVQNPPPNLLKQECHRNAIWIMKHAAALPEIHMMPVAVDTIDGTARKITAVVENYGYLPTNITNKAISSKAVKKDLFRIVPGEGMTVSGAARKEVEYVEGYMNVRRDGPAKSTVKVSWYVKADKGSKGYVEFVSQKGGTVRKDFEIF